MCFKTFIWYSDHLCINTVVFYLEHLKGNLVQCVSDQIFFFFSHIPKHNSFTLCLS